jgi:dolichol-phosphate mannosyltransferase
VLNDPEQRLAYYRGVLANAEADVLPAACAAEPCPERC